jgi:undecaprenyl-diphosphatase
MDATETGKTAPPASGLEAFAARVLAVDLAFFRVLGGISLPKAVAWPLILLVRVGDGWIWALIAAALWYKLPFAMVERVVLHCALAIGVSLAIYFPIKFIGKRPRPYDKGLGVTPMVPPLDKWSFPSGHTMNNLSVALTLSLYFPSLVAPALAFPLLLGTLRVFFGVHYLSDIVGGCLLGTAAFSIAWAVFPVSGF